ncbi:unnamed protein product, partial [Urochloa humidicola]
PRHWHSTTHHPRPGSAGSRKAAALVLLPMQASMQRDIAIRQAQEGSKGCKLISLLDIMRDLPD